MARRAALREQAAGCGAAAIALGHTRTDQAETVLMHAIRGAGLAGLAAMAVWEAPWLRPLLAVSRTDTRALCGRLGLAFVDDPTNIDPAHPRVRMREQVLPALRGENPRVEAALAGLAEHAADAEEALEGWGAREAAVRRVGPATWSTVGLAGLPRAVRTRVVRRICGDGGVDLGGLGHATVAAAGVLTSVALAAAMAIMVASFRHSVDQWLGQMLPADLYMRWLEVMYRVRRFEEKGLYAYSQQKIRGFFHVYIAQEAIAGALATALRPEDKIVTAYRQHGIALARGLSADSCMAELYGKATGCVKGKGGSMHFFSSEHNYSVVMVL